MGILNLDLKAGLSPSKKICVICLIENLLEIQYKTQEMSDSTFSEDPFLIVYCPDKSKTQRIV